MTVSAESILCAAGPNGRLSVPLGAQTACAWITQHAKTASGRPAGLARTTTARARRLQHAATASMRRRHRFRGLQCGFRMPWIACVAVCARAPPAVSRPLRQPRTLTATVTAAHQAASRLARATIRRARHVRQGTFSRYREPPRVSVVRLAGTSRSTLARRARLARLVVSSASAPRHRATIAMQGVSNRTRARQTARSARRRVPPASIIMVAVLWHRENASCAHKVSSRSAGVTEPAQSAPRGSMQAAKAARHARCAGPSASKTNLDRRTARRAFTIVKQARSTRAAGVVPPVIAWNAVQESTRRWQAWAAAMCAQQANTTRSRRRNCAWIALPVVTTRGLVRLRATRVPRAVQAAT